MSGWRGNYKSVVRQYGNSFRCAKINGCSTLAGQVKKVAVLLVGQPTDKVSPCVTAHSPIEMAEKIDELDANYDRSHGWTDWFQDGNDLVLGESDLTHSEFLRWT